MKKRLDVLLVERGLADSRSQAQALVLAGRVPGHAKAGMQVEEADRRRRRAAGALRVARRREARARAQRRSTSTSPGSTASTSGRRRAVSPTVLLQRGAARVVAVDVGYGQLHLRLREDARVTVLERDERPLPQDLPFAPDFVVV